MMTASFNSNSPTDNKKPLINKDEVIATLKNLINDYPGDRIPSDMVKDAFKKIAGYADSEPTNSHPAFEKFEQTIAKAKTIFQTKK